MNNQAEGPGRGPPSEPGDRGVGRPDDPGQGHGPPDNVPPGPADPPKPPPRKVG